MEEILASLRALHASHPGNEEAAEVLDRLGAPGAVIRQPPVAAQAVLQLARRPYGADQMVKLIERDPALSQSLLRHANSAWYGGSAQNPIMAIKPAIQRVGTKGIHATVMFEVVQGEISRPGGEFDPWARMVWEHMVRAAPIARALAPSFGADPDEAFTLALLHDVGKLVIFDRVAAERKRLRRDVRITGIFLSDALSRLHELLGGIALLEWGLDPAAAAVVADHHRRTYPPSASPFSEVVYLAEHLDLAHQHKREVDLDRLWGEGRLTGPKEAVEAWVAEAAEGPRR
jgi:HD-like signal output (HDOD) protein